MRKLIDEQAAIDAVYERIRQIGYEHNTSVLSIIQVIRDLPSAQAEIKEIDYSQCADAMLKMWIDKVVTDGEYYHIMDKLNIYWAKRWGDEVDS